MAINTFPTPSTLSFSAIQNAGRSVITANDHNAIVADLTAIATTVNNLLILLGGTPTRVALTGASYTVPNTTSVVRFIQTSTVSSQTVVLPVAMGDGHSIQFVNYTNSITSLTFSPSVVGWSNTSTLNAPVGIRIRWDAVASAWYREE